MGLFDFLKKSNTKPAGPVAQDGPYQEPSTNVIYHLLFCDEPELYRPGLAEPYEYPFDILFGDGINSTNLQKIIADVRVDPRLKLLAYNRQRASGNAVPNKELLGVIIELGLDAGLDVLASFQNGTARYINQTGKIVVWETEDASVNALTNELFVRSRQIINQIGPWDKPRKPAPGKGHARLSFLVSDGLYFGEAAIDVLFNDPLASPALETATQLMQYITQKSLEQSRKA